MYRAILEMIDGNGKTSVTGEGKGGRDTVQRKGFNSSSQVER